jgi:DNA-binding transcriptional MerR regulator
MKTISEVSVLAGISRRTLHYYDQIGLLKPSGHTEAGYRLYDEADLERLWQIMFYRELEFSLAQIGMVLGASEEGRHEALLRHRSLLSRKHERLNNIIGSIDKILRGEFEENMLNDFDMKEIEEAKMKYGEEAQNRWGDTEAYRESARRTAKYTKEDWARIKAEQSAVYDAFMAAMEKGCESAEAQEAVRRWQKNLNDNFYNCSPQLLAGLGKMYVADAQFTENIDRRKAGLAEFMSGAIAYYCETSI